MKPFAVFASLAICRLLAVAGHAAEPIKLDSVSAEQARLEAQQLKDNQPRTLTDAMAEFRKTAAVVHYFSDRRELPGYLYRPRGDGPFPAVVWNHGSEKEPRAQPELARFYPDHGFV